MILSWQPSQQWMLQELPGLIVLVMIFIDEEALHRPDCLESLYSIGSPD